MDAGPRHGGDGVGDHGGAAGAQGFEEVAVRAEAEALLPRVVARGEVRVVRDVVRQLLDGGLFEQVPGGERVEGAELVEEEADDEELQSCEAVGHPGREEPVDPLPEAVDGWLGEDVAGAPLQHGDVGGRFCERGDQSHGRGAAADDDDFLVLVVEAFGPELRVDDSAGEFLDAGHMATQRFFVVVISGTEDDEACVKVCLTLRSLNKQIPRLLVRGPIRRDKLLVEFDLLVDTVCGGGLADVGTNGVAVRNVILLRPWPPREAKGVKIRVGAEAGVPEEVPGAAYASARFEDSVPG